MARYEIAALKAELEVDPEAGSRCLPAARSRTHKKAEAAKKEPKASTTDAQARRMRFADGGVGAGFDLQLAVSTANHVIVGVRETDRRNDAGFAGSMVEQLERRYGARSARLLADTRYATRQDPVALGGKGVEVDMPPPVRRTATAASVRSRERRLESEPVALRDWRARKGKRSIAAG